MYQRLRPHPLLRPFVESIWVQEAPASTDAEADAPTTVLPTTMLDLVFHYGDPFLELGAGSRCMLPASYITGQRDTPITVAATGRTGIILVSLFPWGAAAFFQAAADTWAHTSIRLGDLAGPRQVVEVEERLLEAEHAAERVHIVEAFLLSRLREDGYDALVVEAAHRVNRTHGEVRVEQLAGELCLSRRQLVRRFKRVVGLSPKPFANIIRFQKALGYARAGVPWAAVAAACRYHDQAHLIKAFRRHAGVPPSRFASSPSTSLARCFNLGRETSHFYNTIYVQPGILKP